MSCSCSRKMPSDFDDASKPSCRKPLSQPFPKPPLTAPPAQLPPAADWSKLTHQPLQNGYSSANSPTVPHAASGDQLDQPRGPDAIPPPPSLQTAQFELSFPPYDMYRSSLDSARPPPPPLIPATPPSAPPVLPVAEDQPTARADGVQVCVCACLCVHARAHKHVSCICAKRAMSYLMI